MVGGLVEQQEVAGNHQHSGESVAVALSAGEHADALEYVVFGEEEAAEDAAEFGVAGARRDAAQVFENGEFGIEDFVLILGEVIGLGVVPEVEFAGGDGLFAGKDLDERRFSGAVHADESDAVAAFDVEGRAGEDVLVAVAFRDVLKFGDDAATGLRLGEAEVNGFLIGRDFDALDFFQFLDAALHLFGFGGLGAEAVDKGFEGFDAVALVPVSGFELHAALGFLGLVF